MQDDAFYLQASQDTYLSLLINKTILQFIIYSYYKWKKPISFLPKLVNEWEMAITVFELSLFSMLGSTGKSITELLVIIWIWNVATSKYFAQQRRIGQNFYMDFWWSTAQDSLSVMEEAGVDPGSRN